jgi:NADH-quinone oxidoreductase subunit H
MLVASIFVRNMALQANVSIWWQILQFVVAFLSFFGFVLTSAIIIILAERKVMGWMQDRLGPMHTGPWGLLQTVADVGKLLLKEDIHAGLTDKMLFLLAPMVFLAPVIGVFAIIPLSPYVSLPGTALATGIVYYVAMSSIDIVGLVMAGWSSNNKYSLIGGLRSAAQMISYELPLVLSLVSVVMLTSILSNSGLGTISIRDIQTYQSANLWPGKGIGFWDFVFEGNTPWAWFFLVQPLMVITYYTCGLAETNRSPFDLPEAESELVAGYMTEYSSMRFGMFYLGEYGNMMVVSAIATYLFLGGFSGPGVAFLTGLGNPGWGFLGNILAILYFILKVYGLCIVFIWVRTTLPRLRADQLMQFAWLILIPTTLFNIVFTAALFLIMNSQGAPNWLFEIVLGVINWAMLVGFVRIVSRATVATTRRAQAPAIRARRRVQAIPTATVATPGQLPERAGAGAGTAAGGTQQ